MPHTYSSTKDRTLKPLNVYERGQERQYIRPTASPAETEEDPGTRRVERERSMSSNHTLLTLVFLKCFRMRPVPQSTTPSGLVAWLGQQALEGAL